MQIEYIEKKLDEIRADFEIVFIQSKNLKNLKNDDFFKLNNYKGEGSCLDINNKKLFIELKSLEYEDIRLAFFNALKTLIKLNLKIIKTPSIVGKCVVRSFASIVEGILVSNYDFDK